MSTLDDMTSGASIRKYKEATTLTPVGLEKRDAGIPDLPGVFLANEALQAVAVDLRAQAAELIRIADGIDLHTGTTVDPLALRKRLEQEKRLLEQEADRKAADREKAEAGDKRAQARVDAVDPVAEDEATAQRIERLTREAQAHAFAEDPVAVAKEVFGDLVVHPAASASPKPGWVCPTHGDNRIKEVLTRKGRTMRVCELCTQFER